MRRKQYTSLRKLGISPQRERELRAFCAQYNEWISRRNELLLSAYPSSMLSDSGGIKGGKSRSVPERIAEQTDELLDKILLVERCAHEAVQGCPGLYKYLLANVTESIVYERMPVPIKRDSFYRYRARFFALLDKRKK